MESHLRRRSCILRQPLHLESKAQSHRKREGRGEESLLRSSQQPCQETPVARTQNHQQDNRLKPCKSSSKDQRQTK